MPRRWKYVHTYIDARGKMRHDFRFKGRKVPLPKMKGSPEFEMAYEAALAAAQAGTELPRHAVGSKRTVPGSMGALIVSYYGTADYKQLSASTKATYRGIIERFRDEHGSKLVRDLEGRHIRKLLSEKSETPAAANNLLRMIKLLMRHAVEDGWRKDDPTYGVRPIKNKTEGFHTWTEQEIERFEAKHALGTRARLAFDLLIYTGQRRSDVITMGWQHVDAGTLRVRQQKTGVALVLPIVTRLARSLDHASKDNLTFLLTAQGKPFTAAGFGNWFRDVVKEAGLGDHCAAHGLRKAACRRLAEDGCSPHEIMSISGHRTLKEVERYTKAAGQARLAAAAMARGNG